MGKILKLLWVILALMSCSIGMAQSMITISKDTRLTKSAKLDGKAGVIFMSKANDLVISSTIQKDQVAEKPLKVGNHYEYEMQIDVSENRDRVFNVSQRGTAIGEKTGQVLLRPDEYVYFNVEMVDTPIIMEQGSDGDSYFGSGNGWVLIEFNSELKLKVTYSPKLKSIFKSGRNKAGAYVDSLIVNIDSYQSVARKVGQLKKQYEDADSQIDILLESQASEEDIKLQEAEVKIREKEYNDALSLLNELIYISVKGEGTNERTVDPDVFLALQSKEKLRYNILVLSKEVQVFKTKYEEMVHQAESHKKSRDYHSAQQFYASAAEAEGASESDRQAALQSAEKMGELATFKTETDALADRLYNITSKDETVNKNVLFELIDNLAERYRALNRETNDSYYLDEANRLISEKGKVGVVFKGRFVMSAYKGGNLNETTITNVRIYGSQVLKSEEMKKRNFPNKGELITTVTAPDGRFSITLQPNQYHTLIFEAVGNKDIKENKYVSVDNLTEDKNVKVRFPKD